MSYNINQFSSRSGRVIREDGTAVNEADGINADGSQRVTSNVSGYGPVNLVIGDFVKPGTALAVTGTTGNVVVETMDGDMVTIPSSLLPVGTIREFPFQRIIRAGTTASGIWAWWGPTKEERFPLTIPNVYGGDATTLTAIKAILAANNTRKVRVLIEGDSIGRGEYTSDETTKSFAAQLATLWGASGGFIAAREGWYGSGVTSWQTLSGLNGGIKRVSYNTAAQADTVYSDTSGVTGMLNQGGFAGEYVRMGNAKEIRFRVRGSKITLLYMDAAGGAGGKASVLDGSTVLQSNLGDNTVSTDTPRSVTYNLDYGNHVIKVRTTSGNFNMVGLIVEDDKPGIVVNRSGREAWKTADWANRTTKAAFDLYPQDIVIIALGTNDSKDNDPSTFTTNLTTLYNRFADADTKAVFYIMHQPGPSWGVGATAWPNYVAAIKTLAGTLGTGYIDGAAAFGSYADAVAKGLLSTYPNDFTGASGADVVHPSDLGAEFIARLIAKALTE